MNCNNCGCGLNILPKEIGKDDKGIPVYHRIGYCAYCGTSIDLDMIDMTQNNSSITREKSNSCNERKGQSILGIIGFILSFISIFPFLVFIPLIFCYLSLKQKNKKNTFGKGGFVLCAMLFVSGISILSNHNEDEAKKNIAVPTETKEVFFENPVDNKSDTTIIEQEEAEVLVENKTEYTEEEYKNLCQELYYDDIFFGDDNLEDKYVKVSLMLSEKYFFTSDDMLSSIWKSIDEEHDLMRDFYKCCVLREDSNSYVGRQINLWFSEDFELSPDNYKTGNKVVVYAKVINWSNNTWDGYNSVTMIPMFIEKED